MQIAYEIDEADFIDASLAASFAEPGPSRRGFLPGWVLWALVGSVFVGIAFFVAVTPGVRADAAIEGLLNLVSRGEWLLPWFVWCVAVSGPAYASRQGRRAYRLAALAAAVFYVAAGTLVLVASRYATEPSPLESAEWFRLGPWVLLYSVVLPHVLAAWSSRGLRRAYAQSEYVGRPRVVTLDDAFLHDEGELTWVRYRWTAFTRLSTTARLVLFYNRAGQLMLFIPKRSIGDAAAVKQLVDVIESRIDGGHAFAVLNTSPSP